MIKLFALLATFMISTCIQTQLQSSSSWAEMSPARRPKDSEMSFWLRNMKLYHHYSNEEITAAVGIPEPEITELLDKYAPPWDWGPAAAEAENLFVLPYPGGRHPRIGFLEGAVDPQRETKFSVF